MTRPPRTSRQRTRDTLNRLEHDVDAWVATVDPADGTPYLVPLSFLRADSSQLIATRQPPGELLNKGQGIVLDRGHVAPNRSEGSGVATPMSWSPRFVRCRGGTTRRRCGLCRGRRPGWPQPLQR
jgi:hypothetical protein